MRREVCSVRCASHVEVGAKRNWLAADHKSVVEHKRHIAKDESIEISKKSQTVTQTILDNYKNNNTRSTTNANKNNKKLQNHNDNKKNNHLH